MMSSTASGLLNSVTRPSALAAVPFALEMPRIPERACIALARAILIRALDTVLAFLEACSLVLEPRRSALRSLQRVSCFQAGSFRAHLSNESSYALSYCEQAPNSRSRWNSQPTQALQPPRTSQRHLQVVNIREPGLESEEEPSNNDESHGQHDGAGSSWVVIAPSKRKTGKELNCIGPQGPKTYGQLKIIPQAMRFAKHVRKLIHRRSRHLDPSREDSDSNGMPTKS